MAKTVGRYMELPDEKPYRPSLGMIRGRVLVQTIPGRRRTRRGSIAKPQYVYLDLTRV